MEIEIQTGDELNTLLDALAREITKANDYYRLFRNLISAIPAYEREILQSNTFWTFVIEALRETYMGCLCRIYDQQNKSLNLVNLLDTMKANHGFFSEAHFRQRLAKNAFVDSLARTNRIPRIEDLEKDILQVSDENPRVKKLIIWRNNIVAHIGSKVSLGKKQVLLDNPLSEDEVEVLVKDSLDIFNKYSSLYRASTHSQLLIGGDDYKILLKFLGLGLKKHDEDIEKEIADVKARFEKRTGPK
jgi:hypothetical protein